VNRLVRCLAAGLLLAGCAAEPAGSEGPAEPGTEFAKPTGASRNPRIGTIGLGSASPGTHLLHLNRAATELSLKKDEFVVSRGRDLKPTGLLRIVTLRGQAAIATTVRGHPEPDDEVVLPSAPLRQQAEALPPSPPGS
jgi:hypothetical protein